MESALDSPPPLNKSLSVLKQLCNNSQLVEPWRVGYVETTGHSSLENVHTESRVGRYEGERSLSLAFFQTQ